MDEQVKELAVMALAAVKEIDPKIYERALDIAETQAETAKQQQAHDLDAIWQEVEECWRVGRTPADVINRLYAAACYHRDRANAFQSELSQMPVT